MANELPNVTVVYSNGNLLANISIVDGICGLVYTVNGEGLIGVPKQIFSLDDAVTAGFTLADEPDMYRQIKEFYDEVGGNMELWVMGTAETFTMADALDNDNDESAVILVDASDGKIRLLGVGRVPDEGYNPGNAFVDADVEAAILKANTFGQARLAEQRPLRVLIEGRVVHEDSLDVFSPLTSMVGFAGVVLGGSRPDGSASIGTALGRKAKYAAQIKLGKVANGPLSLANAYIGSEAIKNVSNLKDLHATGYISFMQYQNLAGFYFGIDRMASTDDYRLLVYGCIIDKAALIAYATYTQQIESDVDVDADGKIDQLDIEHLVSQITLQVNTNMGDQISGFNASIDPNQDVIDTSELKLKMAVRPRGYTSFITVTLGLSSPAAS